MVTRRSFVQGLAAGGACALGLDQLSELYAETAPPIDVIEEAEDIFSNVRRVQGHDDHQRYLQILGAANPFKEGDEIIGVAAPDETSRQRARQLLAATRAVDLALRPPCDDQLTRYLRGDLSETNDDAYKTLTLGRLKNQLLHMSEADIKELSATLPSHVIGCLVKLMTNEELVALGAKIFNPLPGSQVGAEGYLGARVQPNSPTDNVHDIRWQVFDAFCYSVGDVLLGTNPVSSDVESVAAIERTLQEILVTFGIDYVMPHCVLAHVDVQADVESKYPGSTALWFQSIAGTDGANGTFDISIDKMKQYADGRNGPYGMYFETGQGADFTNGHGNGFDMVLHEARKYGFARALSRRVARARVASGHSPQPWMHLNDVAGFIGPEVFRKKEQLVRCCLEDIVMGKLHGLCLGLDVCSTLHMDVSLDDLDWCLDRIMPACPAYLMALPTKIDPMLGYLTTGYQDHVRLREKFGRKVDDRMWQFFQRLQIVDQHGQPTKNFGDPIWVYTQFRRAKGDQRSDATIRHEGEQQLAEVRSRGVFVASGYGQSPGQLHPKLKSRIESIYRDAKESIWAELSQSFIDSVPMVMQLSTMSADREDYILHPESGEAMSDESAQVIHRLRQAHKGRFNVQLVISDGLNAHSISDDGHLHPFLNSLRSALADASFVVSPDNLLITSGRVRAGYRVGEALFSGLEGNRAILHVIGERPGSGHHTFSIYITAPNGHIWSEVGRVDHNITKVVSGVATTALRPIVAAKETVKVLQTLVA